MYRTRQDMFAKTLGHQEYTVNIDNGFRRKERACKIFDSNQRDPTWELGGIIRGFGQDQAGK